MTGDYLQIFAPLGASGPVAFGLADAMDNHHNVTSGRTLTCSGKPPATMSFMDWAWLTDQIGGGGFLQFDGHVSFEGQSPLQQLCVKAASKAR